MNRGAIWMGLASVLLFGAAVYLVAAPDSADDDGQADAKGPSQPAPITAPSSIKGNVIHVRPGESIQRALDAAAASDVLDEVHLHPGQYRPTEHAQALVRFNRQHDGLTLKGVGGDVVLTAANPDLMDPRDPAHPACVNHIVYFGDGISARTKLQNVTLTGANRFVGTDEQLEPIEPDAGLAGTPRLEKGLFFFADGGAVKIFGRSAPTLEDLVIIDNQARVCAGGISVEQRGYHKTPVTLRNIQFINNRCPATGAAVDLLGGSAAVIENCLFVGNIGNTGMDEIAREFGLRYNQKHGCGALTVFPDSRAEVTQCTFTGNWNGVDDRGNGSRYSNCLFWKNDASDGTRAGAPYEMDSQSDAIVKGCVFGGNKALDLRGTINRDQNVWDLDPHLNEQYVPQNVSCAEVGWRPSEPNRTTTPNKTRKPANTP